MKIGDFVKGLPGSPYRVTTEKMIRGVVVDVNNNFIIVKVLEHEENLGGKHEVNSQYFEVIGHVKPFNREEILELLKNGCKKAILEFDLRRANLRRANIDFTCLPLRCGGLHWKIDKRQAAQLTYHLCSMQCDDEEFIRIRNFALPLANQMHRADVPRLEPIEETREAE